MLAYCETGMGACIRKGKSVESVARAVLKEVGTITGPYAGQFGSAVDVAAEALMPSCGGTCLEDNDFQWIPVARVEKHTGQFKDMAILVWLDKQPSEGTILYAKQEIKCDSL